MAMEALSPNEVNNFVVYDTISATPPTFHESMADTFFPLQNHHHYPYTISQQYSSVTDELMMASNSSSPTAMSTAAQPYRRPETNDVGGRKRRRRKARVCKNKAEAETQRMKHIAVERNRRRQMNDHLSVLRSLMPESYVRRGDQASIVGGAIEFVKELESLLQSLEAQKFLLTHQQEDEQDRTSHGHNRNFTGIEPRPFSQFFSCPQYSAARTPDKNASKNKASVADIEVNLVESHANVRVLAPKRQSRVSKMVGFLQTVRLSVMHLIFTTLDPLVLYCISVKVEEGCRLNSADDIAGAFHQVLQIIEEEAALLEKIACPFTILPP